MAFMVLEAYFVRNKKSFFDSKMTSSYSLIDITIDKLRNIPTSTSSRHGPIKVNPSSQEEKLIIGRKAEDIVFEYLTLNSAKLHIQKITKWCQGNNRDDSKGYDISYEKTDGTEVYIEVKGSKLKLNGQVLFEMSANEYKVMMENINNYYIFYVDNIDEQNIIKRISANDIIASEPKPESYRIKFESKIKDAEPDGKIFD